GRDDSWEVIRHDDGPVLDAIGQLREVYPNVISVRPAERAAGAGAADRPDVRAIGDAELFDRFFRHVTGSEPTAEQRAAFIGTIDAMTAAEREVHLDEDAKDALEPQEVG